MGIKITGISTPVGGLSWEIIEIDKQGIKEMFNYLETKRLLINPMEMEIPEQCALSALEIKRYLVDLLQEFKFINETEDIIKNLCNACNTFLDGLNEKNRPHIIYKNDHGDWCDMSFSRIMKEFRTTFRTNIAMLENEYKIDFKKEIPEQYWFKKEK